MPGAVLNILAAQNEETPVPASRNSQVVGETNINRRFQFLVANAMQRQARAALGVQTMGSRKALEQ